MPQLPRCFFDVSINGIPSGRIVFELFKDDCPKTVENFRCLCTGERGEGRTTFKPLFYRGTPIHRIVKGFIIQGGDFSKGDGTGGESIYGGMFKDEGFKNKHDQPCLLSMANKGPNTNGSQFFITTRPAPHLDGIHVVFGRIISGIPFVTEIENQKVDMNHRPYADVRITHSGELVLQKKTKKPVSSSEGESSEEVTSSGESSSESESETEEEKKKRKRRLKRKLLREEARRQRKKKKKKRSKDKLTKEPKKKKTKKSKKYESSSSSSESDEGSNSENEPVTSTVPELEGEQLPPELKSNRPSWLYRRSRTPSPTMEADRKEEKVVSTRQPTTAASYKPKFVSRNNQVSQSGRKLKGRGNMRYRTPPRFGNSDGDDLRNELQSSRRVERRARSPLHRQQKSRSKSKDPDHTHHDYRGRGGERSPPARRYQERRDWRRGSWRDNSREKDREGKRDGGRSQSPGDHVTDRRSDGRRKSVSGSDGESHRQRDRRSSPDGRHGDGGGGGRRRFRSRSPERRRRDGRQRGQSRSHSKSRSPSGGSRMKSSSRRSGDDHKRRTSNPSGGGAGGGTENSKWSRHRDEGTSSSEDDKELERAFQKHKQQGIDNEGDVFGLNKLLT